MNKNTDTNNYFAYGSNLNIDQMKKRCPSAKKLCNAILGNYKIEFPRTHRNWPGGVASVIETVNENVEGVIYEISKRDLLNLDDIENVSGGEYFREERTLLAPNSEKIKSWVYFAHRMDGAPYHPSITYIQTIIQGAKTHNLSDQFLKVLESYLINEETE